MEEIKLDQIDLQFTENVSFLADCFDNSFLVQSSISYVKDYVAGKDLESSGRKGKRSSRSSAVSQPTVDSVNNLSKMGILSQLKEPTTTFKKKIKNWGLPLEIAKKYEEKGITDMFDWQVSCLSKPNVLLECQNLVYSAPTSAGKTLVAEILTIKTVLERQKKAIIILPFVSIVREKMFYLQNILSSSGIRVEGFMGSQSPPGGLQALHIAICTIEKANSLVNKLLDEGNISELGAVIVDELHLLGDPHRGYILELLLTKIKYISKKCTDIKIQVIGMSATLPNLGVLANWLEAELFVTEFRPIPLNEYCLVGDKYYDKNGKNIHTFHKTNDFVEADYVLSLCLETIKEGCSVLIFCMTKSRCENLAQSIALSFYKLGCKDNEHGKALKEQIKLESILEVLEQLKNCPIGLDQVLKNVISFGVAYHHAGLTFDERDIIEGAFKTGAIRVLVATSTLSSGVNLPARKVIIRSPIFQRQPINILTYKQMIGRAGRMGIDTKGESILICTLAEQKIGLELMMGTLQPVKSCIDNEDKFMRAILEIIASQDVCTKTELDVYTKCTLFFTQQTFSTSQFFLLEDTLRELINYELIRIQTEGNDKKYSATSLGKACLASSMAPNDGLSLFCEIQKARQCLVLETDLHLIYLVTPYSVSSQWNDIDWLHLLTLWESLTAAMKRVGELVGVQESFIVCCLRGGNKSKNSLNKLNIHKRFYTALALQDLVNEIPLSEVACKFQCARGFLQGLQQSSATFAGMVTIFCHQLGWKNMETLISQFQDRLHFGIQSELVELMKLPSLNGIRARTLFDGGFETISSIAAADINIIENTLYKSMPFQSEKEREDDDDIDVRKRNKLKNIWITGYTGMTTREAAINLILEARKYLTLEIGVSEIKWKDLESTEKFTNNIDIVKTDITTNNENASTTQNCGHEKNFEHVTKINLSKSNLLNYSASVEIDNILETSNKNIKLVVNDTESDTNKVVKNKTNGQLYITTEVVNSHLNETKNDINCAISGKKEFNSNSCDLTEDVFVNFSSIRTSENFFSPNISFGENLNTPDINGLQLDNKNTHDIISPKTNSTKDISLFSSEGDSSDILEESLNGDDEINRSMDHKENTLDIKYIDLKSKSILNAFESSVIVEEDEDIKLVYDDDNKHYEKDYVNTLIVSQENEIAYTQEHHATRLKNSFISPLKRHAKFSKTCSTTMAKKAKTDLILNNNATIQTCLVLESSKSTKILLQVETNTINCVILKENDVITNFECIENALDVSIIFDTNLTKKYVCNPIGRNIILNNQSNPVQNKVNTGEQLPIQGIVLCLRSNLCIYLDLTMLDEHLSLLKTKLIQFFSNISLKLKMFSTKTSYILLKKWLGQDLPSKCIDITLAEWLLDSDEKISKIIDLAKKYCDIDLLNVPITVEGEEKKYGNLNNFEITCLNAWCVWTIADRQSKSITMHRVMKKTLDTEIHVSKILGDCEFYGITVDKILASQLLIDVKNSLEVLQKKAFKLCGYHFNFNASKDVAKVLGIYRGRKVSTKKSVLCAHNSPIASIILYWRKLNSILTKTLYPLTEQAFNHTAADRINPSYTVYTCTGRISMHEPNLQNVPRTFSIPLKYLSLKEDVEPCDDFMEFNCRNIFKASPGYVLVSADYCQLEMRILTHYCKDAVLCRIMNSNIDVFKSIAASWSGVPEEQVDDDLRQKAKQLCYGIIYGMGNKTLAQVLDVNEIEAAMFMDTFYKAYPAIKSFTQDVIEDCRKNGYVETLMRRRRYLPDINSNAPKRSSAERQAVNTTIQGSAADIAKAAMCAIDKKTQNDINKPHLILQMHDELIYEVIESEKTNFIPMIRKVMEDTVQLSVPLPVKVKSGHSWGTMEEVKL